MSEYAAGDRVRIETWDGGTEDVTITGFEWVLCPRVQPDDWTESERAHYSRLGYRLEEKTEYTVHPNDVFGKVDE